MAALAMVHNGNGASVARRSCSRSKLVPRAAVATGLPALSCHHQSRRCSARECLSSRASSGRRRCVVAWSSVSVDPLAQRQGAYTPGKSFIIHGPEELEQFTQQEPGKSKLTVLMAKASHCRPCKKFAAAYHAMAAQFSDSQLLEIVGDESKETRKMMVEMKVRVTPSFFLYRNGQLLHSLTGTKQQVLRLAIMQRLTPGEAQTPDLTSSEDEEDEEDDDE